MTVDRDRLMQAMAVRWTQAQPTIAAFISSLIPDFHDSEDVLQRVAATVIAKADEYDSARPFVGWAMGIARIEALRFRSTVGRDRLIFDEEVIQRVYEAYESSSADLDEMKSALMVCLNRVKGRPRQVLELHYIREQKPARVAQQLGMTANAVFVTLHRVRQALKHCIEGELASARGGQS